MTISHVIYLEFARLIVSWQWVTEVTGECKDLCISMYFIYFSLLFFLLMTDPFVLDTFSDG